MSKKYLLIGSIPTSDPQSYGGATVLMQQMLNFFKVSENNYMFIQANKYSFRFSFAANYLYVLFQFLKNIFFSDIVILNVSRNGAFYVAPVLLILTKIFRKKFVFRMFGGDLLERYNQKNIIIKKLADITFIENSDLLLLETKFLVEYFKKRNHNILWFPNTRSREIIPTIPRQYNKKFVFISQIKREKGIDEILKATEQLNDITVDLFGPILSTAYNKEYFSNFNVEYKGVLTPDNVTNILDQYDVLLLPTYFEGEGYPGIIIEAYSLGIPVITTNWKAIPEIVNNDTGILISPKNSEELISAIESIDNKKYFQLSKGSYDMFLNFDTENICKKLVEYCELNL